VRVGILNPQMMFFLFKTIRLTRELGPAEMQARFVDVSGEGERKRDNMLSDRDAAYHHAPPCDVNQQLANSISRRKQEFHNTHRHCILQLACEGLVLLWSPGV
jgi:hypothetical protein